MAIKCPTCHFDNSDTQKFCGECGTPLSSSGDQSLPIAKTIRIPLMELTRGTLFARRFEVIEELGKGGMGRVYRAFDKKIEEEVALKIIKPEIAAEREVIDRFWNELKMSRKISHRNVSRMYDLGEEEGTPYITMEYVPGEDLKSFIHRSKQLSTGTAVAIAKQVCDGLEEAHRLGIIHRDLKPGNIMIDKDGNAKIMDFGIARSLKVKGITGAGVIIGTPEYMSPEQVEGKDTDHRSDLYSLGIVLYEMLTGRVPFEGETPFTVGVKQKSDTPKNPKELNPQIPDDLSRLVLRCLDKDKEKRCQSAGELRTELEKIEQGIPTTQRILPQRTAIASKEISVKFRLQKLAAPALAVVAVVVIAVVIWRVAFKKETRVVPVPGGKPSIAVLYFKNNTGDAEFDIWRSALSDSIITDLSQSRFINVLSTDQLLGIFRRLGLLEARAYASEDIKKVAVEGRVTHILQGSLSKAGDLFRIDYTVQEAGSGGTIGASRVEGKGEASIFAMVDELTRKIKSDLKLSEGEISSDIDKAIGQITTSSPEAYKYFIEADRVHNLGENRKAIGLYEKAVAVDPEFASAYRSMGVAYGNLGYSVKSRELLKKAFNLSNRVSDREKYRIQAEFYALSDKTLDKSIEAFKNLLALYPDDSTGNNNLGLTYSFLEEWDLAVERLKFNIQIKDEFAYPYATLANCYVAKGMFDEARKVLDKYLSDFSDNAVIRNTAAIHYLCRGSLELAQTEIEKALALAPGDIDNICTKGVIFLCRGNLDEAEKEFQKLLSLEEKIAATLWLLHMESLRVLEGRITESRELSEKGANAAEKSGENSWESYFLYRAAYNHLLSGAPQNALITADRFLTLASKWESDSWQMMALHMKGIACLRLKDLPAALKAADDLKRLVDRSLYKAQIRLYFHLMGQIEMERKDLPKAIEYFERAIALLPFQHGQYSDIHAFYIDALARAYFQAQELGKAKTEFERILSLTTGRLYFGDIYAKSFYLLGLINEKQGLRAGAIECYEKFLGLWKDADPGFPEVEDAGKRLAGLKSR